MERQTLLMPSLEDQNLTLLPYLRASSWPPFTQSWLVHVSDISIIGSTITQNIQILNCDVQGVPGNYIES
jgi:hypothetical protein